jgi:hypothetical protein
LFFCLLPLAAWLKVPVITSFSPAEGPVGTQVQIIGTNLLPVTAIEFNGVSAEFTGSVNFPVVAVVPAGATTGTITLRTITNKGSEPVRGVQLADRFVLADNYVTDGLSLFPEPLEIDASANSRAEVIGTSASQDKMMSP